MSDRLPGSSYDNPVWHKGFRIYLSDFMFDGMQYEYVHDDYDPTPLYADDPPSDNRHGYARTIDNAKAEIDAEFFPQEDDAPDEDADPP